MIITALKGGLGNQMFAYAAGLALAERLRTVLKLDVRWFRKYEEYEAHNRYALSCFNITEQFATEDEIARFEGLRLSRTERWSAAAARVFRLNHYAGALAPEVRCYAQPGFAYDPGFASVEDNTYIVGIWQTERFFQSVAPLLRLHFSFRYPPQPAVAEMAARIRGGGPSAFMHFRRGDYVTNPTFNRDLGVLSMDYYKRALRALCERVPGLTLYLFSDDMDFVEREFRPDIPHVYVRATEPWHSYDKIRLMSLCDHGIISNSTFAWWAGWLNPNPDKIIIAPNPWFALVREEHRDVVPESWLRISTTGQETPA